jgi:hypothetical protein
MENTSFDETTQFGIAETHLPAIDDTVVSETELTKTIQSASLAVLLRIIVTSKLTTLSIPVDNTATAILLELLDMTPKLFDSIQQSVELIVQDGKINAADIPHLYKAITEAYPLIKNSKIRPSSVECAKIVGTIVKVVIHVLVSEHKIKVANSENFLKEVDTLVDAAIELVSLAKIVKLKTPKCSRIFGRK